MRRAIILAAFFCAACSNYSANFPSLKPYRMDVQQGNVVTSKMMMQLRPGMTKSQVRFIMGTPLIADSFHADRWDYLYRMQKGGKLIEQRHVILEFENDQLKRVRGDVIPAGSGEAATAATETKPAPAAKPAAKPKEKSLADRLKFWKGDEAPASAKQEVQPELAKEAKPVEMKAAPAPAQAAPSKREPAAAPQAEAAPAPVSEPARPAAEPAPEPAAPPKAEAKAAPRAEAAAQPAAKPAEPAPVKKPTIPADELPPEDDPGYFERMLEKIGF